MKKEYTQYTNEQKQEYFTTKCIDLARQLEIAHAKLEFQEFKATNTVAPIHKDIKNKIDDLRALLNSLHADSQLPENLKKAP